jgi:hypothetical protein
VARNDQVEYPDGSGVSDGSGVLDGSGVPSVSDGSDGSSGSNSSGIQGWRYVLCPGLDVNLECTTEKMNCEA